MTSSALFLGSLEIMGVHATSFPSSVDTFLHVVFVPIAAVLGYFTKKGAMEMNE